DLGLRVRLQYQRALHRPFANRPLLERVAQEPFHIEGKMISDAVQFFRTGLALPTIKRLLGFKPRFPTRPELGKRVQLKFEGRVDHRCFGCSPDNPVGLHLSFFEAEEWDLACRWEPRDGYENYPGLIHGGLVFSVLDELLGAAIFH